LGKIKFGRRFKVGMKECIQRTYFAMFPMLVVMSLMAFSAIGPVSVVFVVEEIKSNLIEKQAECQE
jgi:uncharacterized alpha-E superfamily protein